MTESLHCPSLRLRKRLKNREGLSSSRTWPFNRRRILDSAEVAKALIILSLIKSYWLTGGGYIPKMIYHFTGGAAQHFKNKYRFSNPQAHKIDFSISVE